MLATRAHTQRYLLLLSALPVALIAVQARPLALALLALVAGFATFDTA